MHRTCCCLAESGRTSWLDWTIFGKFGRMIYDTFRVRFDHEHRDGAIHLHSDFSLVSGVHDFNPTQNPNAISSFSWRNVMKTYLICFSVLVSVLLGRALHAQVPPEFPKSQPEHKWLQQFVGQWESELECKMGPDQPTMKCKLAISSRMLGDFWVVNELSGDMMGTPMVGIQTIGYDTEENAYVGTWVDSMMNHMWKYEGSVDESGIAAAG